MRAPCPLASCRSLLIAGYECWRPGRAPGRLRGLSGGFADLKADGKAGRLSEGDERVETEIRNASTQHIIQARLRHAQTTRGISLRDAPALNSVPKRDEEIRPHGHIGGGGGRIFDSIPHIVESLAFHQLASNLFQAGGGKVEVAFCGLLRFLLKGMEHIHGIRHLGDIYDPKGAGCVSHPNFPNTGTNTFHRFPVGWIASQLNLTQFETKVTPDVIWKRPKDV